jgi:DNA-binding transcriptional regulator GbsR (MarR family)
LEKRRKKGLVKKGRIMYLLVNSKSTKMNKSTTALCEEARGRLIEVAGATCQELGLGRVIGQILVYLYLQEKECSLDEMEADLGLSKASVSIAARQLESMALLRRVWKKGTRKRYYRTADNIGSALRQGLLAFARQKFQVLSTELEYVQDMLRKSGGKKSDPEAAFLQKRVKRAKQLCDRASSVVESPLLRIFVKS